MKTSKKLREYFGSPSTMLEPLLQEVERLERNFEDGADEYAQVGKAVFELGEGQGIARGNDLFFLIESAAGRPVCSATTPFELITEPTETYGPEFDAGER